MKCVYCGTKTSVTNSRSSLKTRSTWRRRTCTQCRAIFTTTEFADLAKSVRVKYPNNTLKPFLRDKLFISIFRSLSHRKTPLEDATALTDTILSRILAQNTTGLITNVEITEITVEVLSKFDNLSAAHYRAHHN